LLTIDVSIIQNKTYLVRDLNLFSQTNFTTDIIYRARDIIKYEVKIICCFNQWVRSFNLFQAGLLEIFCHHVLTFFRWVTKWPSLASSIRCARPGRWLRSAKEKKWPARYVLWESLVSYTSRTFSKSFSLFSAKAKSPTLPIFGRITSWNIIVKHKLLKLCASTSSHCSTKALSSKVLPNRSLPRSAYFVA